MSDAEREVESPCNRVCTIDPATGYCIGCLRTLDEISRWHAMTNAERARLVATLGERQVAEGSREPGESSPV